MSRSNPRILSLLKNFDRQGIDALLVSSWPNVTYLSGFMGTESWLLITRKKFYFITDSRYLEQAIQEAKGFSVVLRDKKSVADLVAELAPSGSSQKIGFESQHVTYSFYQSLLKVLGAKKLVPTNHLIEAARITKDASEIACLKKSAEIAVQGYHYIRQAVRPGMTEREVQGRLEFYTKSIGSEKPAFDLIIAAGARASMPHCQSNETLIKNNDSVLVDMGTVYRGYYSDLTRPIFLGKIPALHKKIYDIVWEAQRAGIQKAGPGVSVKEVDEACRSLIRKYGYDRYFGHGTGHGVGLEIHEAPSVSGRGETVLKPGMVITVEPGIYLPKKVGIRIEDMVLITQNGREVLTAGLDR